MITLTREEAQQVLDCLDDLADAQQWEIDMHATQYGEGYKPHRVKHMKEQLANTNSTIEALRTRLAQPEHVSYAGNGTAGIQNETKPTGFLFQMQKPEPSVEPVAWHEPGAYGNVTVYKDWAKENGWQPLYTAPPQREWQELTDEEIIDVIHPLVMADMPDEATDYEIAKAIEAKLKEKNT